MTIHHAISHDRLYTMRQLNQQTAEVLKEINDNGQPALITRHGRFIAAIIPLVGRDIQGEMVAAILDGMENKGQLLGSHTLDSLTDTVAVADELDLNLPVYPDRDV